MRVMLLGATGFVGAFTLRRLLANPGIHSVVAPSRVPLSQHSKLENILTPDLLSIAMREDVWQGLDAIICAVGTTRKKAGSDAAFREIDFGIPIALAKRAAEAGVGTFLYVSSLGADSKPSFLYTRTKGEVEDALRGLGFRSLTIARPSFISGARAEKRWFETAMLSAFGLLNPVLPRWLRANSADSIAALLVESALERREGLKVIGSEQIPEVKET